MAKSIEGKSREEKMALAASLDLQEPVGRFVRYAEPGSSRYERGQLELISMMSMIVMGGDKDLIEGALLSPSFVAPQVMHQSRDYHQGSHGLGKEVAKAALRRADLPTLILARERMAQEKNAMEHHFNVHGRRDYGDTLYELAAGADANKPEDVAACAQWVASSMADYVAGVFICKTDKQKKERDRQARATMKQTYATFLELAAACGSLVLAGVALKRGASFMPQHVSMAFENGNPKLAGEAWMACASSSEEARVEAIQQCTHTLALLARSLKSGEEGWTKKGFDAIKGDVGDFIQLALAKNIESSHGSALVMAQRELLAQALPLAHHFDASGAWIRSARAGYPQPLVEEIASLALANKWTLLSTRLTDAQVAGVDEVWRASARRLISKSNEESSGREKTEQKEKKLSWAFKLAVLLQPFFAGNEHPALELIKAGWSKVEVEKALSEHERESLGQSVAKSAPSQAKTLRV
jgi:hypothetical protein